jgi:hypothetical protein
VSIPLKQYRDVKGGNGAQEVAKTEVTCQHFFFTEIRVRLFSLNALERKEIRVNNEMELPY